MSQFVWFCRWSLPTMVIAMFLERPVTTAEQGEAAPICQPVGQLVRISELPEASGVAVSRRSPGRLWAHNDSGAPVLVALDQNGSVTGRIRLSGAKVEDWEAVAVAACPAGSCIYVADIGDNDAQRASITIYRVPEPEAAKGPVTVTDVFHAQYPDGSHDAEALLVTPKGDIYIVTKGDTGPVAIFRWPPGAKPGATVELQSVGQLRPSGRGSEGERITDAALSPSGTWVALRSTTAVSFHRASELLSGQWRQVSRISLESLGEAQGEGIAFADERTLYLVGEGGSKSQPGTLGRLTCTW